MKLILVVAISKDEFITKGSDQMPGSWTSDADKQFFASIQKRFELQVMGSGTYDVFKPTPNADIFRVVLTGTPEKYKADTVSGQLEFLDVTPQEFVNRFERSRQTCLLLGGSRVYSEFLDAHLVDELYITVEPDRNIIGVPFLTNGRTLKDIHLPKPDITKLNEQGTELHHYIIKK